MKSDWQLAVRHLKRAMALSINRSEYEVHLCGDTFCVGYETRTGFWLAR